MQLPKFFPILDPSIRSELLLLSMAGQLIDGGARWIQLRNKIATSRELLTQAVCVVRLARAKRTKIIINDRADVAWLAHAHGVHVGQSDLNVRQVRKILGPQKIVGVSTHNLVQALAAAKTTASYIAVGPIFPTQTKLQADPVVGLLALKEIRQRVSKPIVAIGGIKLENARDVIAAGADAVAVIRDVLQAKDIAKRTQEFIRILEK